MFQPPGIFQMGVAETEKKKKKLKIHVKQQENLHLGLQGKTGRVPPRCFRHPVEETHIPWMEVSKGGRFFRASEQKHALI